MPEEVIVMDVADLLEETRIAPRKPIPTDPRNALLDAEAGTFTRAEYEAGLCRQHPPVKGGAG